MNTVIRKVSCVIFLRELLCVFFLISPCVKKYVHVKQALQIFLEGESSTLNRFFYMTKISRQKFKYVENEKNF